MSELNLQYHFEIFYYLSKVLDLQGAGGGLRLGPLRLPGRVGLGHHVPCPVEQPEPGPLLPAARPLRGAAAAGVFVIIIFFRVILGIVIGGAPRTWGGGVAREACEGEKVAQREAAGGPGDGGGGCGERGGRGEREHGGRRAHRDRRRRSPAAAVRVIGSVRLTIPWVFGTGVSGGQETLTCGST